MCKVPSSYTVTGVIPIYNKVLLIQKFKCDIGKSSYLLYIDTDVIYITRSYLLHVDTGVI